MRMIKWASEVINNNLEEAEAYIEKAYSLREKSKAAADWCREMAAGHLAFNTNGHTVVTKLIEEVKTEHPDSPYTAGMQMVWNELHSEMIAKTAELKARIDLYK